MAAPSHNVVRIIGSAPGGEVWSINPKYAGVAEGPITEYEDLLAWATAIGALNSGTVFPTDLRGLLSTACAITTIRTEYIDASGNMAQAAEYALPTAQVGTGTANKPLQVAWCLSLLTGRPGRSFRGRLFWPAWSGPVIDGTFRVASSLRISYASAMRTFLDAVGDAAGAPAALALVVVSQTASTFNYVTSISLGDVLDTQRRRRDALIEQRTVQNYPS